MNDKQKIKDLLNIVPLEQIYLRKELENFLNNEMTLSEMWDKFDEIGERYLFVNEPFQEWEFKFAGKYVDRDVEEIKEIFNSYSGLF